MLDGARCDNRGEYDQNTTKHIYKNALLFGRCAFLRETCISFLKLYFYYFLLFVYVRVCTYVCRCPWRPEASDLPEAELIYRCELSAIGAGKCLGGS